MRFFAQTNSARSKCLVWDFTELIIGEKKMKDRVVETQYGAVSGVASDTEGVVLFKGIPIGADTAGQNRFREPQPAADRKSTRLNSSHIH